MKKLSYFTAAGCVSYCFLSDRYYYDVDCRNDSMLYKTISTIHTKWKMHKSHNLICKTLDNPQYKQYDDRTRKNLYACMLEGHVISGRDFNTLFDKPVKYINSDYKHHNMCYNHVGEYSLSNDSSDLFYPFKESCAGGLYFTADHNIQDRYVAAHKYVAKLTIPVDACVYVENDKFKTDKFTLGKPECISR